MTATPNKTDLVEIVYYSDPLCCWSWAIEPQWRRLLFEYSGKISWRYCMGGLIPAWNNFNDTVNLVSRPIQMGPIWMEASHISGMQINDRVWMQNPPASSYPACIAVNCAFLQSFDAGEKYLRLLREAVMLGGRNIALLSILEEEAARLAQRHPDLLDLERFKADMKNDNGLDAFKKDMQEVKNMNITRFPSLIFRAANKPSIIMTGYQRYPDFLKALKQMAPELVQQQNPETVEFYRDFWETITPREIAEVFPES